MFARSQRRQHHVGFVEQNLTLQIGDFNEVTVGDDQVPHPRPREHVADDRAQRPATNHQRGGAEQLALPVFAESRQEHLTVVSFQGVLHDV